MSQETENHGRPNLGGPVPEQPGQAPADLGFQHVDEDDYDPEAARRMWLENRERQRLASQGTQNGQGSDTGSIVVPRTDAIKSGEFGSGDSNGRGSESASTSHVHVGSADREVVERHVQQPVDVEVTTTSATRTSPQTRQVFDPAPAQPEYAPQAKEEVIDGNQQKAPQTQSPEVVLQRPVTEGAERGNAVERAAPISPAYQHAADPAPQTGAEGNAPTDTPRRVASLLEAPIHRGMRNELMELKEDDPSITLSGMALVGGLRSLNDSAKGFAAFFRSLQRDGNGNIKFRNPEEEDVYNRITQIMQIASPSMQNGNQAQSEAWKRDDIEWHQHLATGADEAFTIKNHPKQGKGLMSVVYRRQNSGAPVTVFLPASGFFITSKAPHENDFCDYDVSQTMDTNQVGQSTFGILLSASSGLYLKHMVNFALKFVVDTTLDVGDGDMHQTLYNKIDERDYWLVVMACTIAKYPSGIPWLMACTEPQCGFEEEQKLNIARCIRYANGVYAPSQLALINRQREGELITFTEQEAYRKAHTVDPSSKFKDGELTFLFTHAPIARYIDTSEEWVAEINKSTTDALGNYATEQERNTYMRTAAETRRLTRYLHFIDSIASEVDGEPYTERDPAKIREILVALSSDRQFVVRFEAAIEKFNERSRLAIFGYMSHKCPGCGAQVGEEAGSFRGIVEISPDRLFFVLSRVVYEIQKLLADQYESIG